MDLTSEFTRKVRHFKVSEVMRVCCEGAPDVVKLAVKDSFLPGDYILATLAGLGGPSGGGGDGERPASPSHGHHQVK